MSATTSGSNDATAGSTNIDNTPATPSPTTTTTLGPGYIKSKRKKNNKKGSAATSADVASDLLKLKSFKGVTPDIGAVLCLSNEDVDAGKEGFPKFQLKLEEYVLREYDNARDLTPLIINLCDPVQPFETKNFPKARYTAEEMEKDPIKKKIVENSVNAYTTRLADLSQNVVSLYGHIWGQCTPAMQAEIKASADYDAMRVDYDALWLLKTVKKLIASIDDRGNKFYNAYQVLLSFNRVYQREGESEQAWLSRFQAAVETVYLAKCDHIFYNAAISEHDTAQSADDKLVAAEKKKFEAIYFLMRSDKRKFGSLQDALYMDMIKGVDHYPTSPTGAYDLLLQYANKPGSPTKSQGTSKSASDGTPSSRVSFAMVRLINGDEVEIDKSVKVAGADGVIVERPCYNCGKWGHIVHECPDLTATQRRESKERAEARRAARQSSSLMQVVHSFVQSTLISPNIIMLDSCSESSVFMNPSLVTNIHECEPNERIMLVTNGNGSITFDKFAVPKLFPQLKVHFNSSSMANILSLRDVAALPNVTITMDTSTDKSMEVHLSSGLTYIFREGANGLYFFDTSDTANHIKSSVSAYLPSTSFLSTVSTNKSMFTSRQIEGANRARLLHEQLGWPSIQDFKRYVVNNSIINCKVTTDDIARAEFIYGTALPILKGKMVRSNPKYKPPTLAILPPLLMKHHGQVDLYADFLYVNKLPFLHTKSKNINFLTVQNLPSRKASEITKGLQEVLNIYHARGFNISSLHGDNEFNVDSIKESLLPVIMQVCARNEHVGIAERSIRTIKDRARSICHSLPYKRFTKLMTTRLIENTVYWLNAFPSANGISNTISPRGIVVGTGNIDCNHSMIQYGAYAAVYETTKNNMMSRSTPAIALKRSNDYGGHFFMSLDTGQEIHGSKWVEKPINEQVIARVHELAIRENQPLLVNNCPMFEWSPGNPIDDEDDEDHDGENQNENLDHGDVDHVDDAESQQDEQLGEQDDIEEDVFNVITEDEESQHEEDEEFIVDIENNEAEDEDGFGDYDVNEDNIDDAATFEDHNNLDDTINNGGQAVRDATEQQVDVDTYGTTVKGGVRRSTRSNRGRGVDRLVMNTKGKKYRSKQAQQYLLKKVLKKRGMTSNIAQIATKVMFTQMSAKKGIKMFGEHAIAAMFKEYKQLDKGAVDGKPVIRPIDTSQLTLEQKRKAMRVVNLIKKKRCGKVKGRACADGSQQRKYLPDDESVASPTTSLESVNTSFVIDAFEHRYAAITDIPGAYLHADIPSDKEILMKFVGEFVDILCDVNPEYKDFVQYENGVKVLYVKVLRAIYGCIFSALLWYELFSSTLEKMGFEINPYDRCVANKVINGKQCTIIWYVDDLKISHQNKRVVMDIIKTLEGEFGKLEVQHGPSFSFLGVDYEINQDGTVSMHAQKQIQEAIDAFPEPINRAVRSPAGHGLFQINEDDPLLVKCKSDTFHSLVMKLMWIEKRVRPDIETAIAFLSTRVSCPNITDWSKLKRVLQYLHTTIHLKRIIGADNLHSLYTWIDAAYAVHPNMRSHTGGCMSMGLGTLHCKSSKQKLNTKSSTEAEVVGMSDYTPYNIWLTNFLQAQGYALQMNEVYQDNQSAIKMERNGRNSCTGNSRHVHIRYFFVKDRVDKKEITISYCPTEAMLADFFTKPLQGTLFEKFRDVLLGYRHITSLTSSSKERVGDMKISNCEKEKLNVADDANDIQNESKKIKKVTWADVVKQTADSDVTSNKRENLPLTNMVV